MKLEKAHESKNEHFIFTLTDSKGQRVYGICLRALFRGPGRRFDVGRRLRHCLCFITKLPFFSMFRALLLQIHSLGLIEQSPNRCKQIIDLLYQQSYKRDFDNFIISRNNITWMMQDFTLISPANMGLSQNRLLL